MDLHKPVMVPKALWPSFVKYRKERRELSHNFFTAVRYCKRDEYRLLGAWLTESLRPEGWKEGLENGFIEGT